MIEAAQFSSLLISAFLIGLLGAGHCAGMCGGFVSAFVLGGGASQRGSRPLHWLLNYNIGRVISYMIAGLGAGMLGSVSLHLFDVATARAVARMLAAFSLVAVGLYLSGWPQLLMPLEKLGHRAWAKISPRFTGLLRVQSSSDALRLGLVWGWLPCGLVYSALLSALTTGDALMGAQVMLFFGLGTLPALLTIGVFATGLKKLRASSFFRRACGATVAMVGVYTLVAGAHH